MHDICGILDKYGAKTIEELPVADAVNEVYRLEKSGKALRDFHLAHGGKPSLGDRQLDEIVSSSLQLGIKLRTVMTDQQIGELLDILDDVKIVDLSEPRKAIIDYLERHNIPARFPAAPDRHPAGMEDGPG